MDKMSKKLSISTETQVLLKLLRLSLDTEPRRYFGEPVEPLPTNINWKEVIRLSYEHKVSALAVDGLKSSGYDIYKDLTEQQIQKLKPIVDTWFNNVAKAEQSYTYCIEVLNTLCQILKANGLIPIILKGYGLSLNYPTSSHRGAGDIDLFLLDKNGAPAAEKGDILFRNVLKLDERDHSKCAEHHSIFTFKGITIENHSELSCPVWNTEKELTFIKTLETFAIDGYSEDKANCNLVLPSSDFNALYLIRHIFVHINDGEINFRQLCDYYTFLRQHQDEINWDIVNEIICNAGIKTFVDGIDGLLIRLLGASESTLSPYYLRNTDMEDKLLYDIFHFNEHKHIGVLNVGKYYRDRWHYKFFQNQNWVKLTIGHTINKLKRF